MISRYEIDDLGDEITAAIKRAAIANIAGTLIALKYVMFSEADAVAIARRIWEETGRE